MIVYGLLWQLYQSSLDKVTHINSTSHSQSSISSVAGITLRTKVSAHRVNYTKQASFSESVLTLSLDTCRMANRKGSPWRFSLCANTYIQGLASHAKISIMHQNVHTLHYAQTSNT